MAKLKKEVPTLSDRMDKLFVKLDKVGLTPASIFKSDAQKEHYESLLMFAFRKRESAGYHRRRVNEIAVAEQVEADKVMKQAEPDNRLKLAEITVTVSKSNNDYAHELAAFCAAIRSAIDFLAKLMAEHTKSAKVHSITSYLSWANEGRRSATVNVVAEHAKWLIHVRDYRDYLLHRLVVNTPSGFQRVYKHGKWTNTVYPILVPSDTPKHVPDTRSARALEDMQDRFDWSKSGWQVTDDEKIIESETHIEFHPRAGEIRIEKMMDRELKAFEKFFCDVVDVLLKVHFQPVPLPHPTKVKATQ